MPKYIYKGKVDFIEPSLGLEYWIIKPNQVIEIQKDLPQYLLDSGLFEKISDEPYPIEDRTLEYELNPSDEIEVDIDNEHYNYLKVYVVPDESNTDNTNIVVDVYQNYKTEETKSIVDLYTTLQISNISPRQKNVYKLILKSRDTNTSKAKVRIHLYRENRLNEV